MSEHEISEERTGVPEKEEVASSIDGLLDAYSDVLKAEEVPGHPDFQARKASLKRQLDQHYLDEASRRENIQKMVIEAEERFKALPKNSKPDDYLASAQRAVAQDDLARAYFLDDVDWILREAQVRGEEEIRRAMPQSDEEFLSHATKYRDMLMQKEPSAEVESRDEAKQIMEMAIAISFVEKAVERAAKEAQAQLAVEVWQPLAAELAVARTQVEDATSKAFGQLGVRGLTKIEQLQGKYAELSKKPQPLLAVVLYEISGVVESLLAIKRKLSQAIEKNKRP